MREKPQCFAHFGEAINNPNCDVCHLRLKCYEEWNQKDKTKRAIEAEQQKPWSQRKPLSEIFPEACESCG